MLNEIIRYFDLQSERRDLVTKGRSTGGAYAPVLPQYIIVCFGVVIEPYLRHYINSGSWQYDGQSLVGRVLFGLIVGIIILPGAYKSSFDPGKPILVQLAALFPLGIGWQSLVASAAKIVAG